MQSKLIRIAFLLCAVLGTHRVEAALFVVNSPADVDDGNPGDGICQTSGGVCTLRAALQEANAFVGSDTITLQANTTYLITQSKYLNITDSVYIGGAGVDSTIIDGNNTAVVTNSLSISQCLDNQACDASHTYNYVTITGLTIQNTGQVEPAIFNLGTLTIDKCKLTHNKNATDLQGAAIHNSGNLFLNDSTVIENGAIGQAGNTKGGGLYQGIGGTMLIKNSLISANAADFGGGIYVLGGKVDIINSTISGNFSKTDGGGIYATGGLTTLYNATVAFNLANADDASGGVGGGVYNASQNSFNVINSIIAMNSYDSVQGQSPLQLSSDCAGTITSQGHNIFGDIDAIRCTVLGSVTVADPQLEILRNNGGPTLTHALAAASPAVDAGNPSGCTDNGGAVLVTDQRGIRRPSGPHCDIGAFESDRIFEDGFQS